MYYKITVSLNPNFKLGKECQIISLYVQYDLFCAMNRKDIEKLLTPHLLSKKYVIKVTYMSGIDEQEVIPSVSELLEKLHNIKLYYYTTISRITGQVTKEIIYPLGLPLSVEEVDKSLYMTSYPKRRYEVSLQPSTPCLGLHLLKVDYSKVVDALNAKFEELHLGGKYNKTWFLSSLQVTAYEAYGQVCVRYNLTNDKGHCAEQSGDNGVMLINSDEGLKLLHRWEEYTYETVYNKVYVI